MDFAWDNADLCHSSFGETSDRGPSQPHCPTHHLRSRPHARPLVPSLRSGGSCMMATVPHVSGPRPSEIADLLTCPVCLEVAEPPAYQCTNGHLICGSCRDSIDRQPGAKQLCPTCRAPYGSGRIRSLVADALSGFSRRGGGGIVGGAVGLEGGMGDVTLQGGRGGHSGGPAAVVTGGPLGAPLGLAAAPAVVAPAAGRRRSSIGGSSGGGDSSHKMRRWTGFGDAAAAAAVGSARRRSSAGGGGSASGSGIMRRRGSASASASSASSASDSAGKQSLVGVYEILSERCTVSDGPSVARSRHKGYVTCGAYVHVTEVRQSPDDPVVRRGKLESGGWITLKSTDPVDHSHARPLPVPATYVIQRAVELCNDASLRSSAKGGTGQKLRVDDIVEISCLHLLPKDRRVRARLSTGQWISLVDTERGHTWARPQPLGAYVTVSSSTSVTVSVERDSARLTKMDAGEYLEIVHTQYLLREGCLRGRLESGGWITLIERARGRLGAVPVGVGAYRTHPHLLVRHKGVGTDSGVGGETLKEGSFVEIVETRYLSDHNVVRGKVASGGWITLIDCASNYEFAIPVNTGVRVCARKGLPVCDSVSPPPEEGGPSDAAGPVGILPKYSFIEVTETRYLSSCGLVRGRLVWGGWITLVHSFQGTRQPKLKRRSSAGGAGTKSLPPIETAKAIRTGTYLTVVDPLVVSVGAGLETKKMGEIKAGRLVEVVEIRYIRSDDRVRGRVSGGGWITLVNGEDRKNYAKIFGK